MERRLGRRPLLRATSRVTEQVIGYQKQRDPDAGDASSSSPLDLPPQTTFETEAVWFLPEPALLDGARRRCRGCSGRCTRPSTR